MIYTYSIIFYIANEILLAHLRLGSPTPRSDARHWRTASWSWFQQICSFKQQGSDVAVNSLAMQWFCWWLKSCTTKDDDYPIIYRVLTIPGGAGFQPSTVPPVLVKVNAVQFPMYMVSYTGCRPQNHVSSHLSDCVCAHCLFYWHVWHFYH